MDEMQFDRTRKAIGTEKLDDKVRQQMLGKLTGAGGQVVDERALKKEQPKPEKGRAGPGGDPDDRKMRQVTGARLPSQMAREAKFSEADQVQKIRRIREEEEREASSFLSRFFIKIKCKLKKITPFGMDRVLPEFLSRLNLDARRAVMECNILGMDLFATNPEVGRNIIKELDAKNPLLVELLDRAAKLYDRVELSELVGSYQNDPNASAALDSMRAPVISFVRKLYYLRPYQETYLQAAELAIDLQERLEKKGGGLYSQKKKKIRSEWKALHNDLFPALVLLIQRMEMKKAEPGTWLFEEIIKANPEERPGRRKVGDPLSDQMGPRGEQKPAEAKTEAKAEEAAAAEEPVATEEDKKAADKTAEIGRGYQLMGMLAIENLRKKYDLRSEWKNLLNKDKVFLSYLFFKEFEDEYSLILTSAKVRLNANYSGGAKVDYKQKLADDYEGGRQTHDLFRKYLQETTEFQRAANDPVAHTNYVEHAKRVQLIESRRGGSGRSVRVAIKETMARIATDLEVIIEDMKSGGQIVANAQEAFRFDVAGSQNRKLEGKQVRECFHETYCFALALRQRLDSGDLFGGVIEMSDADFQKSFPGQEGASD